MPELIDRQALINDMCNNKTDVKCPCYPNCYPCDFSEVRRVIDIQPTIEPEVRHGRWISVKNGRGGHECDQCHNYAPSYQTGEEHLSDYCQNCGAQMDATGTNVGGKGDEQE